VRKIKGGREESTLSLKLEAGDTQGDGEGEEKE